MRGAQKRKQWKAFLARNRLEAPTLDAVVDEPAAFVRTPLRDAAQAKPGRGPT
jgi:hypothetical protein